jgi:hypothetical protein
MAYNDVVLQVKELLDRHLDVYEIAHRLHEPIDMVQFIIDKLT